MSYGSIIVATCPCGWQSIEYKRHHAAVKAADRHYGLYHGGQPAVIKFDRTARN